jgi:hypothetical protein
MLQYQVISSSHYNDLKLKLSFYYASVTISAFASASKLGWELYQPSLTSSCSNNVLSYSTYVIRIEFLLEQRRQVLRLRS